MQKHMTIKEMPDFERPYEKCIAKGAQSLSDAELISVIIRTGSQGERSLDLANRILNAGPDGLLNLVYLNMEELTRLRGIGNVKAVQLKCVAELSKRLAMQRRRQEIVLDRPDTIASYYMERLRHESRELLLLTMYNTRNMLIADEVISIGTADSSLVSPREIFQSALQNHASYIVMLHNHPSGNPEPSNEDINVTIRIKQCGELLGILLMDHIIIGDNRYFSFREQQAL